MVGTGEALLNVRARGGPAAQANGKGAAANPTAPEFDFQSELQKFDKVRSGMKFISPPEPHNVSVDPEREY